jgi:uncharacterized membrane protein
MIRKVLALVVAALVAAFLTRPLGYVVISDPDLYGYVDAGVAMGSLAGGFAHIFIVPRMTLSQLAKAGGVWVALVVAFYLLYAVVWGDSQTHAAAARNTGKVLALLLGLLGAFASTVGTTSLVDKDK